MEVRVGPLVITMHAGDQFLVCKPDATLHADEAEGYFVADTRLVSHYALTLSRVRPVLVNSSPVAPFSARFEFVNDRIDTTRGPVERGDVHLRVDRVIGEGVHEDYDLTNYSQLHVELDLEIRVEGDYADLFDVKAHHLVRRGALQTAWDEKTGALTTIYSNEDFRRGLRLAADRNASQPQFANGTLSFRVRLAPREQWHTCLRWMPIVGDAAPVAPSHERCHALLREESSPDRAGRDRRSRVTTQIETSDPAVNAVIGWAVDDLVSLRLRGHHGRDDDGVEGWVPAAGIPWFVTLFGRTVSSSRSRR